jgi:GNAT superfamily N-acetyltransferase
VDIRPLDLADGGLLADAYAVECAATQHDRPGWVPLGCPARIAAWRAENGWRRSLIGAFEDARLVALATTQTALGMPDTSWVSVCVSPQRRHRGIGTLLARAAERGSPATSRRFVASAYRPSPEGIESLVHGFARPLGYACATTETVVELDLAGCELTSVESPSGYSVSTYLGGVPQHLRAQVGLLKGLVDAEAPNGELRWQPSPVTPQEYDDEIALWQQQGRIAVESIAVDRHGVVVAWTCLVTAGDPDRPAHVEGTMVLEQHRGRRLGAAVKVASLLAAREHGRTTRVRTSSDDQNVWMRSINDELGFAPVESEVVLHRRRPQPAD